MSANSIQSGKRRKQPEQAFDQNPSYPPASTGDHPRGVAKSGVVVEPPTNPLPIPITVKGQRYVAPPGRHSRQTHRRAQERAAAQGHATEKEQHAHDRSLVKTELNKRAEHLAKQQQGGKP